MSTTVRENRKTSKPATAAQRRGEGEGPGRGEAAERGGALAVHPDR